MVNDKSLLLNCTELEQPIKIAIAKSEEYIYATAMGTMKMKNSWQSNVTLKKVLYCENIPQNLLSVNKMTDAGMKVVFSTGGVEISKGGEVLFKGKQLADILTKPLPAPRFTDLRDQLGLMI